MEEIERRRAERRYARRDFRPLPENLRRLHYGQFGERKAFARFYGLYQEMNGILKRFSFNVKIDKRLLRRKDTLAFLMRATVRELKDGKVPEHVQGEVFSDFVHGLFGKPWRRVRTLVDYKAGVVYGR